MTDDTKTLLELARNGDIDARDTLLERFRPKLRGMIKAFLDPRVSARVDASDVLQSALAKAAMRMQEYLEQPAISFFAWLRQITREKLIDVHRQHVVAQRRSVQHEEKSPNMVSEMSAMNLANRLISNEPTPSQAANLNEVRDGVKRALSQMADSDREILLMRCSEHLKTREIADVLGMSETAAKSKLRRALMKLSRLVGDIQ